MRFVPPSRTKREYSAAIAMAPDLRAALLLGPLSLAACAAAPPQQPATAAAEAPPPAAAYAREPSPVDAEMVAIGRAEQEIDRLFPEATKREGTRKAGPQMDAPKKAPADLEAANKEARATGASGDACALACKALASMASSADRLCRLAGENDGRCDDARARVRGATSRVKSTCPSCNVTMTPAAPTPAPAKARPVGPAPGMPGSSPSGVP
jgi:hypothetical protein